MQSEILEVQAFANSALRSVDAEIGGDSSIPAMTTPTVVFTPAAAEYVVVGSTICLIC